jgi:2-polyprenyl-3-methyl-5-hydroxy-6-metoxy-1,4-benzoquinol methylase
MKQTPLHEIANLDLLGCIPKKSAKIVEIGCMSGALSREYKKINPEAWYIGIDVNDNYANHAEKYCDETFCLNIETVKTDFYADLRDADCWIFGDVLEHLIDPWRVLQEIRAVIPSNGSVIACIPNLQHWSLVAKIVTGDFRYESSGLLDRTHLRWFTRQTIIELFTGAGFEIYDMRLREIAHPNHDLEQRITEALVETGMRCGADSRTLRQDLKAFQYILAARPKL